MTHDPLCSYVPKDSQQRICSQCYEHDCECCECDLIARVRADETDRCIVLVFNSPDADHCGCMKDAEAVAKAIASGMDLRELN